MQTNYIKAQQLLTFIEASNTHGRKTLLNKMNELQLNETTLYSMIEHANTNIGKNQVKELWLQAFIHGMQ